MRRAIHATHATPREIHATHATSRTIPTAPATSEPMQYVVPRSSVDIFLFFNAAGYIVGYLSCYRQAGFCNDKDTQPLLPEIAFQSSQAAIRPETSTYVHCPSPTPSGRNDRGMAAERRIIRHKRRSIISSIAIIPLTRLFISPV